MSDYTQHDKTIALIGIYQASQQVYQLATSGEADEVAYKACVNSLFIENPNATIDVFGDVQQLQKGVSTLLAQMSSDQAVQNRNIEITRYVLNLMILAKKLLQDPSALEKIFGVLETAKAQTAQFGEHHENVIATLARAYSENISTLTPRIMVNGHGGHLQNPRIANKIRALLLAGVRAALLWYQVGGSRWGLLWSRKKYLQSAQSLHRPSQNSDSENDDNSDDNDNSSPFFGNK